MRAFYAMNQILSSVLSEPEAVHAQNPPHASSRYSRVDLHCHSQHSDGALSVADLMARAAQQQLQWFSITDHDNVRAQTDALDMAQQYPGLRYITGVEWSALWSGVPLHVVGLNFALQHPSTQAAVSQLEQARQRRTERLLDLLEKKGFWGLREWYDSPAAPAQVGRPHLAEFLVNSGQARSVQHVFKQFLGAGKIGDVKRFWPDLAQVIDWIQAAGGVAVLAHPQRYKLSGRKQRDLVAEFASLGGRAIELGLSGLSSEQRQRWVALAERQQLMGSAGSDFHNDDQPWARLGQVPVVPAPIPPIWSLFRHD